MAVDLFPGFAERQVPTARGDVFARVGGTGPAVLLLHGYPQDHRMWRGVAPALAEACTVVVADLPGYGGSFRPTPAPDHRPHGKRALALDLVEAMRGLGHERFVVAGHDRGGRVAYRMALDHPDRVLAAAALDVVPTGEVWSRADAAMALAYWHWGFLAQPAPLPERLIAADPDAFFDHHVRRLGLGADPERYPPPLVAAYRQILDDAGVVEAICEDYRAGATVDRDDDDADHGQRRIACPLLVLWSATGALPRFYGDVLGVWRPWADDVRGWGVHASHFLVEDDPEQVLHALADLVAGLPRHDPLTNEETRTP
ncbi:alpha/beta hydrolase [Microlunatus flavus]|uniref:Haloacetate dehalogenase n=1 Tax=Microlunatus flavus TaxID=1036181 RepID=A0A1H9KU54_9ACTN|nr:alpha/beta hydrolase [Microlunatus flavus]SER02427.1 haloacetate dehalogenase [Microlunatus flavus]